jgi:DNA-binding MarR family transcriptional regulator
MARRTKDNGKQKTLATEVPKSFRNLMTFRLHMVARLSERVSEEYYRQHFDLSLPECRVIGITGGAGSVSFKKVASDTYLEKSYASRVVSSLVDRGIIEKLENPSDSRSLLLRLTEHGISVHRDLHDAAMRLNARLLASLPPEQVQGFLATLRVLEDQLDGLSGSLADGQLLPTDGGEAARAESGGDTVLIDRQLAESLADALALQLKR